MTRTRDSYFFNPSLFQVTIREALHEIELWGAAAEFSLTSYDDCKGNKVALIKDWKDLLNKV